jgi:hypothetical protein
LSSGRPEFYKVSVLSVRRVDGQPDSCGNPRFADPPAPLANIAINVNVPAPRLSADILVPIVILPPVLFAPRLGLDVNPSFSVNIPVNVGGINFNLSGDSFTEVDPSLAINVDFTSVNTAINNAQTNINNNTNNQISTAITNINSSAITNRNLTQTSITNSQSAITTSTQTSITNSQSAITTSTQTSITNSQSAITANLNANFSAQLSLLNRIAAKPDCPPPLLPPDGISPPPPETPPDDSGSGNKPKVTYLEIVLTQVPGKAQFGGSTGETVFFAGWISFKFKSGGFTERQQINFRRSLFIAPTGSVGYTYTLTNGAKGYALVYTQ